MVELNGIWLIIPPPSPPPSYSQRKLVWAEGELTFFRVLISFQIIWEKWEWMILMSVTWYFSPNMRCQYLLETTQSVSAEWYSFQNRMSSGWSLKPFVVTYNLFCISGGFAHLCICDYAMNIIINVMHDIDGEVHTTPIVTPYTTTPIYKLKRKTKRMKAFMIQIKKYFIVTYVEFTLIAISFSTSLKINSRFADCIPSLITVRHFCAIP